MTAQPASAFSRAGKSRRAAPRSCAPLSRSRNVATPLRQFVVADQHRGAGADPVGPPHAALQIAGIAELDDEPGVAQLLGELQRARFGRLADRHQRDRPRRRRRLVDQHRQPLDAGRPADPRHRRPAHQLDQPVITPAGQHRALRAEIGRDELEDGVRVIIEAAHQPRVEPVFDAEPVEPVAHPRKELARRLVQDSRRKRAPRR